MAAPLVINDSCVIPADDLSWTAVRGSGPGGQNVNKVASKVELRFAFKATRALSAAVKARLRALAGSRITLAGELIIFAGERRDQARNLEDARARLQALIAHALVPPKKRLKTRPTRGSVERRLQGKRAIKARKRDRRGDE